MDYSKKILFVCVENAGRSQMAEGFLRKYAPHLDVSSAGTKPKFQLIPKVVDAMKEIGIDISDQKPKEISHEMLSQSITVNMGCMDKESCPALFVDDVIDWNISDPKEKSLEDVRKIRDEIKFQVMTLIESFKEID